MSEQDTPEAQALVTTNPGNSKVEVAPVVTEKSEEEKALELEIEREAQAKKECCNLVFYLLFLLVFFTYSWLGRGDEYGYFLTEKMKDEILYNEYQTGAGTPVSFYGINNFDDMWNFINGADSPFVGTLLAETGTDGKEFEMYEKYKQYWPNQANILLGGIRIRQLRIKEDSCLETVDTKIKKEVTRCNAMFESAYEEKGDFIGNVSKHTYTWKDDEETKETPWLGKLGYYGGGGYYEDIPANLTAYKEITARLKADNWITPYVTRVVFLDFMLYNPAANLHFAARCAFELPHTGGVRTKADFFAVKLHVFYGSIGKLQLASTVVLVLFVVLFIAMELKEMIKEKAAYFKDTSNTIDWVNIIILVGNISLGLSAQLSEDYSWKKPIQEGLKPEGATYNTLIPFMVLVFIGNLLSSVNAFLLWMKLFRYLSFSPRMRVIFETLTNAATDLTYFCLLFFIFLVAFAHAGYLAFAADVYAYRSISQSLMAAFSGVTGEMGHEEIIEANRYYGTVFVLVFQILLLMILINVFLAIMNDSYAEVAEEAAKKQKDFHFPLAGLTGVFKKLQNKGVDKSTAMVIAEADKNDDGKVSKEEMINKFVEAGMNEELAKTKTDAAFEEYDVDNNGNLNKEEVDKILGDVINGEEEEEEEEDLIKLAARLREEYSSKDGVDPLRIWNSAQEAFNALKVVKSKMNPTTSTEIPKEEKGE